MSRENHQARWPVLAIAGSLRRDSVNRRLVQAAVDFAPDGIQVRQYQGLGELPLFNQELEAAAFVSGPVRELRDQVAAARDC